MYALGLERESRRRTPMDSDSTEWNSLLDGVPRPWGGWRGGVSEYDAVVDHPARPILPSGSEGCART